MTRQRPHPSDLSDARCKLTGPTLTAWRAERRGKGLDIDRPPGTTCAARQEEGVFDQHAAAYVRPSMKSRRATTCSQGGRGRWAEAHSVMRQ